MQHVPDGVIQVTPYPFPLRHLPGSRAISDDDLSWCTHLLYRPGELSLCKFNLALEQWPSLCNEDGYAQSCPSLCLNHNLPDNKKKGKPVKNTLTLNGDNAGSQTLPPQDTDVVVHNPALTATSVPDEQRIAFWPQHFGTVPQWGTLEPHIFAWMDRVCADYRGGIWHFYTLSNGGGFMAPETDGDNEEKWVLFNTMNGNGAEMGAEAAGIAVCLMVYSHHACRTECDAMTEHYYRLRDYALRHPECNAIMHIID